VLPPEPTGAVPAEPTIGVEGLGTILAGQESRPVAYESSCTHTASPARATQTATDTPVTDNTPSRRAPRRSSSAGPNSTEWHASSVTDASPGSLR